MKKNNQSSVIRFAGGSVLHTEISDIAFPLSISILSNDGYLTRGLSEVIKDSLESLKTAFRFDTKWRHNNDRSILFIDIAQVENLTKLSAGMISVNYTDLFIIIPHKDYSFHQALFSDKKENNITYLFLDETISVFKRVIMDELAKIIVNKTKKRDVTKITLSEHTLITQLSKQESVFIHYFKRGISNSNIAKILNKSEKTISGQKHSAMKKIGARTNVELFRKVCWGARIHPE
ncbi:DNA-binding response regulator [Yersinia enterocolitica]|nr:DNA-binding response regulator [Yersinia enterocolitica]